MRSMCLADNVYRTHNWLCQLLEWILSETSFRTVCSRANKAQNIFNRGVQDEKYWMGEIHLSSASLEGSTLNFVKKQWIDIEYHPHQLGYVELQFCNGPMDLLSRRKLDGSCQIPERPPTSLEKLPHIVIILSVNVEIINWIINASQYNNCIFAYILSP